MINMNFSLLKGDKNMGLNKMDAAFEFAEHNYYAVIDLLRNESKNDYEVITTLGSSYFALGEFMKSLCTFAHLFNPKEDIYQLPNPNREKCYPLGTFIYYMLSNDQSVQQMFSNIQKMERMVGYNLYQNPLSVINSKFAKDTVIRYKNHVNKYLHGIDEYDCFIGLLFMEVAGALTPHNDIEIYNLKMQLLERVARSTNNSIIGGSPIGGLLTQGYICVSKRYEQLLQK